MKMWTYLNQDFSKKYIPTILILFAFLTYNNIKSLNAQQQAAFSKNSELFAIDVYKTLVDEVPNKNIIFSPFSIQTCVAMVRIGAGGKTADELNRGLRLVSSDNAAIADSFHNVLANYVDSKILQIANKIYFKKGYTIRREFNEILTNKFFSTAEEINFAESAKAAGEINGWVESKTNNLIKDLVSSGDLNADTRLVLLNAIHFKGVWKTKFSKSDTKDEDFYLNESNTVKVPMMRVKSKFQYVALPELDASVLDLPYNNSDSSLMVILPNSRTGLKSLEGKLSTIQLSDITSKLRSVEVEVELPKFKAEFQLELSKALVKLGISRIFSNGAELGKMLEKPEPLSVSKVIHKAFIEVNEEGTEAAAASSVVINARNGPALPIKFIANKPFAYAIIAKGGPVLFAGNYIRGN